MDGRLFGLSLIIFLFAVLEISAKNVYQSKYRKREAMEHGEMDDLTELHDYGGHAFYGTRYGKRQTDSMSTDTLRHMSGVQTRSGSQPPPKSMFQTFYGTRYGKRNSRKCELGFERECNLENGDESDGDYLLCRHTKVPDLYHCLTVAGNKIL